MVSLTSIFRSGRSTPTSTQSQSDLFTPSRTSTSTHKHPPSSFKRSQSATLPTTRTPPVKVRDYAQSPHSMRSTSSDALSAAAKQSLASSDSPLKRHGRNGSNGSAQSGVKMTNPVSTRPPPTAFTPSRHHRAASGPSPSPLSRSASRARASTLPTLLDSTTQSKPLVANTPSRTPPTGTGTSLSRTPETKKRPAALKLRTSNLTPPRSPTPGARYPQLAHLSSVNPVVPVVNDELMRDPLEQGQVSQARHAEPFQGLAQPVRPRRPDSPDPSSPARLPLASVEPSRLFAVCSTDSSPLCGRVIDDIRRSSAPFRAIPQPFEQIPLPWSLSCASDLIEELGPRFESLLTFTLDRLPPGSPQLLRPSVLRTSAKEDARLRAELERLWEKYVTAMRHRDALLRSFQQHDTGFDPVMVRRTAEGLRKAVARCDRLSRQIFICNDQIRQIEVQGEEHVVGALRVALARLRMSVDRPQAGPRSTSSSDSDTASSAGIEHPDLHRISFVLDSKRSTLVDHAHPTTPTAPTDTMSGLDDMAFPVPPSRSTSSPALSSDGTSPTLPQSPAGDLPTIALHASSTGSRPTTARSASVSQLEIVIDHPEEILIYPPGHRRSASVPLLSSIDGMDLPHTPWRDQHDFEASPKTGTAPLRVKVAAGRKRAKSKSMTHKRRSSDSTRRARRGRESSLETPESILLSLATASLRQCLDADRWD